MKAISPQSAVPTDSVSPWKDQGILLFLHPEVLWLRWVVINFARLENILLLLTAEGNPWSNAWVYLVHYYFYWYLSKTTDQNPSVSFLCIPRWCFKKPGEQAAISPKTSNVNSFCQQIKPDLLVVSWASVSSILLASITLSEAVIISYHSVLCRGSSRSRIRRLMFLVQV